ncbi:MAG: NAD(P)-binding protein [Desulfobacteraceae bacterium]|nr:NAD(P)-binding protein [Desulfobacteraceae bacterium]
MKARIAIVGGGIAGLTTGYLLDNKYGITLFEKSNRIGGNAYTYTTQQGEDVELGVAIFTKTHYTNFFKILSRLHVETRWIPGFYLSFHNLDTKNGLYITPSLKGLAAQQYELFKPKHIKTIISVLTGLKKAKKLLKKGKLDGLTLREGLARIPQLNGNSKIIFLSSLCLISSMSGEEVLDSPAKFFVNNLDEHNFFSAKVLFSLRIMKNKTRSYIESISAGFKNKIVYNSKIKKVTRNEKKVVITMENDEKFFFDKVVFACHADQAIKLLEDPTENEKKLLGSWKYKDGDILLHSDYSSFPKKRLMGLFTCLYKKEGEHFETSVNGFAARNLIVAQHPNYPINKDLVKFKTVLRTPIFDYNSIPTIKQLPSLNGIKNSYYCGSHFGYGLHEDAVNSAMEVAKQLGVNF